MPVTDMKLTIPVSNNLFILLFIAAHSEGLLSDVVDDINILILLLLKEKNNKRRFFLSSNIVFIIDFCDYLQNKTGINHIY